MFVLKLGKHRKAAAALGCVIALIAAGAAAARTSSVHLVAGNLTAELGFFFSPTTMPRDQLIPIKAGGFAELGTKDGTVPPPLSRIAFEVDKNSHVETRGLPVCTKGRLVATTPQDARRICRGSIVGTGRGSGVVVFPEQAPIPASSPVTIFNGPPVDGDPTVLVHAHLTVPAPTTYLVSVRIERVNDGPIGYRIESKLPKIAGGYGSIESFRIEVDRKWRFKGKDFSYLNARCPNPGRHMLGHVLAEFVEGTSVRGTLFTSCQAAGGGSR